MILAATLVAVRLFWLHPPAEVRINGESYRADRPIVKEFNGAVQLETAGSPKLAIQGPLYLRADEGRLRLTLHMPLEEYVAGVLAGESSVFKSAEALKAMAVTARSYAVRHLGRHRSEGFDFCDTTHCQDLRLAARSERLRAAVEMTGSELLWHDGRPADTYYSRHCGGTTEAGDAPYLKQQSDTFCLATGRAEWRCELRKQDLGGPVAILSRTPSGRVSLLSAGGRHVRASDFQLGVGRTLGWDTIRSNFYDILDRGDRLLFEGYGAGHGIGLCQAGAEQRGASGHSYGQILAFYFPGTMLGVGAQGFHWTRMDGERVEVWSTRPHEDTGAVALADRALREAEARAAIRCPTRPRVRIYPTIATFRDGTGESGSVAASTTLRTIRMQPLAVLRSSGSLEATFLHEMLHVLIESEAHRNAPLWLREGLVLYLTADPRPAASREYAEFRAKVKALIDRHGREAVIESLRTGRMLRPVATGELH